MIVIYSKGVKARKAVEASIVEENMDASKLILTTSTGQTEISMVPKELDEVFKQIAQGNTVIDLRNIIGSI